MTYVQSGALEQLSYDEHTRTLRAKFRDSGRIYLYRGVPQDVYDALIFADSLGVYFNSQVRDHYACEELA